MQVFGVLVIAHGSRSSEWVRLVDEAAAAVRMSEAMPLFVSFLEIVEGRLIQDGIRSLENQGVTDLLVVPLFVSSGSTHMDEIRYALGVTSQPKLPTDLPVMAKTANVHFGQPIDNDPEIAQLLYDKIKPLSVDPVREVVMVIGHGSKERGFHLQWRRCIEQLAGRIQSIGSFARADAAMLLPDQLPWKLKRIANDKSGYAVIVVPFFLSEGYFTEKVVPARIASAAAAVKAAGLPEMEIRYSGRTLLPDPLLSRWMERQIRSLLLAAKKNLQDTGDPR